MNYIDECAFTYAILSGYLSEHEDAPNYAGHFMFMYLSKNSYFFKNRDTRKYLEVPA